MQCRLAVHAAAAAQARATAAQVGAHSRGASAKIGQGGEVERWSCRQQAAGRRRHSGEAPRPAPCRQAADWRAHHQAASRAQTKALGRVSPLRAGNAHLVKARLQRHRAALHLASAVKPSFSPAGWRKSRRPVGGKLRHGGRQRFGGAVRRHGANKRGREAAQPACDMGSGSTRLGGMAVCAGLPLTPALMH